MKIIKNNERIRLESGTGKIEPTVDFNWSVRETPETAFKRIIEEEFEKSRLVKFNSQEDFTDKINKLILEGKEQGFSTKDISDKWHTFDELYYHRMILTYLVLKTYPDLSWKSKQHHDGTMFDGSFIVGINTPEGQYSYHYDLEHWDLFDIKELDKAPAYDGHKPEGVIRLISLL